MVDFNKSMKSVIGALKDQFGEIIDDVQNQFPTSVIEVAFVGYAGDSDIPSNIHEPFTTNRKHLQYKAKKTEVSKGFTCDCRMVVEGYVLAVNLQWRFAKKIVFHMGNAPSYGAKYHDKKLNDPNTYGHPYWALEDQVQKLADKQVDVVILKISKTTSIMEKLLDEKYHRIRERGFYVVDLTNNLNNLNDAVYAVVKSHMLRIMA